MAQGIEAGTRYLMDESRQDFFRMLQRDCLDLLEAAQSEQSKTRTAEICSVLNRLEWFPSSGEERVLIETVDTMLDDFYQSRMLICPGHRWLPRAPYSIRGSLLELWDQGFVRWDTAERLWRWEESSFFFRAVDRPA